MKVALCISGYFNSFTDLTSLGVDGFAHIKKHILDKHDVDVYVHSWDVVNRNFIESLYKKWLKDSKFELQINFDEIISKNNLNSFSGARPISSIFSHLYSVQESYKLVYNSNKKYDLVFGTRFDVGRINRRTSGPHNASNPYPVQCINLVDLIENDKIYMANWQYFETEGPCPFWLYGSYDIMNPFCKIYDFAKDEFKPNTEYEKMCGTNDGGMVNVTKLYKWFMIKNGLWENRINLETIWE
jgi:hypothetical protein